MKTNVKNKFIPFLSAILILFACELPSFSVSPAVTPLPGILGTSIAKTFAVAQSQTALFLPPSTHTPTETLLPTRTSTVTPTSTETIIFVFPTVTLTRTVTPTDDGLSDENEDPDCRLISRKPAKDKVFDPQTDFDARWEIENTSDSIWKRNNIDYIYYSGRKMHKKAAYDLPQNVAPGESVTIIVDMVTPKKEGTYSTTWTLRSSQGEFCKMSISIVVK
jgi:hypothetical protein